MTHLAVRELKRIEGERFFRKFDDWLGLMLAAFERDDPTYLKILERYRPTGGGQELNGPPSSIIGHPDVQAYGYPATMPPLDNTVGRYPWRISGIGAEEKRRSQARAPA